MIRTVIIDDHRMLRKSLRNYLTSIYPTVEIVGEASNVEDAVIAIIKLSPDLVFLDVELGNESGFDVLEKLVNIDFKLIFLTAYNNYAIKAIKFQAFDYLLKPINKDELFESVRKTELAIQKEATTKNIKKLLSKPNFDLKITLRTTERIYSVDINEIVRCESDKGYTTFYLVDGRKLLVSSTIKKYDETLTQYHFFRVHQSHLINLAHFDSFLKKDGGIAVMKDGSSIPIASRKKDEFLTMIQGL